MVHLGYYDRPYIAINVDCHANASSFCMITSGPIAKQTCLTGYSTMAGKLRTTLLKSMVSNGPLKQQLTGKQLAKEANVKQAVISWLQHLTQMSFTVQCEHCCNGGKMPVSIMLKWKCEVYHLLPCAMYTLKPERFFGIRLFVRLFCIILLFLVYGCKTWSLTLNEEQRPRVFKNMVLRKIFGAKKEDVMEG